MNCGYRDKLRTKKTHIYDTEKMENQNIEDTEPEYRRQRLNCE